MKTLNSCIAFIACIACIAFIVCIPFQSHCQVSDDFSDGNFTEAPEWIGNSDHFEINSSGQLHLKSAGSDTSFLATQIHPGDETEWRFWLKLSFNTSANNHARIYLAADNSNLPSVVNGYFLQAGGGDDSIFIMKQTAAGVAVIYRFTCYKTAHSTNTMRFKITRDKLAHWTVMIDTIGGENYIQDGTFSDNSISGFRWFGLMFRYTLSNAAKFYFDDFYMGPILYDTVPAKVVTAVMVSPKVFRVTFSEPVQRQGAETPANYQFMHSGARPDSVSVDDQHPEIVSGYMNDSLPDGTIDLLYIRNIFDLSENRMADTIVQLCYYVPKAFDILISEIMADPDPPVGLPDGEFVELYNRSAYPVNLENWALKYGSYSKVFPSIIISPGEYLLVAKNPEFETYARCAVLFTSSTSLSNEGTTLILEDPQQHVIHSVAYTPEWYSGTFKEDGGWSLEMNDASNPCGCMDNWSPSKDGSGGTPGRANSTLRTNSDETEPFAVRAAIVDSNLLAVSFSEAMDSITLLSCNGWVICRPDGVVHPIRVEPVPPFFHKAKLHFSSSFEAGVNYSLKITAGMHDCAGNNCDTLQMVRFAIAESAITGDVVINEILSNPGIGGARFVELYNRSQKIVDLRSMILANSDTAEEFAADAKILTEESVLLFPGDYVAVTTSPDDLSNRYRTVFMGSMLKMNGFPSLHDDSGTVIIARKDDLSVIEKVYYTDKMHYPLLATTEGVSLERVNPDLPPDMLTNWQSAAETAGFATPGYRNSHWVMQEGTNSEINIKPGIFSPDNDGRDDLLTITIRGQNPGCSLNMTIFNAGGQLIRQLANNVLTGSENIFLWNGIDDKGCKARLGFYVLLAELTWPDGTARKIKKTFVVGGKL